MVIEVKQYQPMKEAKLYDYDDSNSKNKDEPVASDAFDKISVDKGKDLDVNVVNDTNADSVDSSEHDLDNDDATVEYLYVRSDFVVDERLRVHGVRNLKVAGTEISVLELLL